MPGSVVRFLSDWGCTSCIYLLILCIWAQPISAQGFLDSLEENCNVQKAYGVVVKLLAVYASHAMTIKLRPGIGTWDTIERYLTALILPSSTTALCTRDLIYRRSNIKEAKKLDTPETEYYKNMQKAINAGAACFRVESDRVWSGQIVPKGIKVRTKPLEEGESFVMIPRGTPANMFRFIMVEGNSQLFKAVIGAIQLAFATIQLVSTTSPRISAYGYGSFTYTIIPYAFGSLINLFGSIMTDSYQDLTEMELIDEAAIDEAAIDEAAIDEAAIDEAAIDEAVVSTSTSEEGPASSHIVIGPFRMRIDPSFSRNFPRVTALLKLLEQSPDPLFDELRDQTTRPAKWTMKSEEITDYSTYFLGIFLCMLHLAIVGGLSRFRNGISTQAERGWFMSWSILGTCYGMFSFNIFANADLGKVIICQSGDERSREKIRLRQPKLAALLSKFRGPTKLLQLLVGVATIGGVVTMIKQYIRIYQC
ncbi:hypothetical protein CPB86DRAFT_835296 [Serendipita vermifera]|nr:hypothetical protein CPB86DRAFT_835296 [Serendipita vermifera]